MTPRVFVLLFLVPFLASSTALAYLDPGSSSILFQAAAAALFTALFVLRAWWSRIRTFFRKGKPEGPPASGAGGPPPPDGRDR
jgi:hypothetical protein